LAYSLACESQKDAAEVPEASPSTSPPAEPLDPDLARVLAAWPMLGGPIRRAILALVGITGPG
jgi:hypothetical protein